MKQWILFGSLGVAALGGMFLFSTFSGSDGVSADQGLTAEPAHSAAERSASLEQPQPVGQPVGTPLGAVYGEAAEPEAKLSIGMPFPAARQLLLDGGFAAGQAMSDGCVFRKEGAVAVKITLSTGRGRCEEEKALGFIRYTRTQRGAQPDGFGVKELVSAGVGAEADCRLATERTVFCAWNDPERYRDLVKIDLAVQGIVTNVSLRSYVGADPDRTPNAVSTIGGRDSISATEFGVYDPRAPISALNPRAPNGVRIGAPLSEVAAKLLDAGFTTPDGGRLGKLGCAWRFRRNNEVDVRIDLRAVVKANGASRSACEEGAVISNISFNKTDYRPAVVAKEPTPTAMIDRWRTKLAADPVSENCTGGVNGKFVRAECLWQAVKAVPVSSAKVTYHSRDGRSASAALVLIGLR
jgi:hypothetical protein